MSSIAATDFADTVNPVCKETGMRRNDIDVAMTCSDPSLRNTLLAGLSKDVDPIGSDNAGLSDDDIANQALPRNSHISDIIDAGNAINDYVSSHEELEPDESVPTPAATPVSAPELKTE